MNTKILKKLIYLFMIISIIFIIGNQNLLIKETFVNKNTKLNSYLFKNIKDIRMMQSISSWNRYFNEIKAYRGVLEEYAYALISNEEFENDKWKNVYDVLFYNGQKYPLYYALKDLSNDGHPELIMGILENISDSGMYIYIIYHYSDEKGIVWSNITENMIVNLYEENIIECIDGGISSPCWYLRFLPDDSGELEILDYFISEEKKGQMTKYYKNINDIQNDYWIEISEKEYQKAIQQYTAVPMKLEWVSFEPFLKKIIDKMENENNGENIPKNTRNYPIAAK